MTSYFNLGSGSNGLPEAGGRKAFVFYTTWYEEVCKSLDEQQQGEFLLTIVRYATEGTLPGEGTTPVVRSMFGLIRNAIDTDLAKYEKMRAVNIARAEKSAAKRRSKVKNVACNTVCNVAQPTPAVIADNEQLQPVEPLLITHNTLLTTQNKENGKERRREEAPVGRMGMGCCGLSDLRDAGQDMGRTEENALTTDVAPTDAAAVTAVATAPTATATAAPTATATAAPTATAATTAEAEATPAVVINRADVAAYWKERRYASDWQEFYAFYEKRGWRNKNGEMLRSWKQAAVFWEDKFRRDVLPARRREAEEERKAQRASQAAVAADIRREEREARAADSDRRAARAVSPKLAHHMYQRALVLTQGNDDRAIDLLRRAPDDAALFRQLCEGYGDKGMTPDRS